MDFSRLSQHAWKRQYKSNYSVEWQTSEWIEEHDWSMAALLLWCYHNIVDVTVVVVSPGVVMLVGWTMGHCGVRGLLSLATTLCHYPGWPWQHTGHSQISTHCHCHAIMQTNHTFLILRRNSYRFPSLVTFTFNQERPHFTTVQMRKFEYGATPLCSFMVCININVCVCIVSWRLTIIHWS